MTLNLSEYRDLGNTIRPRAAGFAGSFLKFNGESGTWTATINREPAHVNGRHLIADPWNLLLGWQKFTDGKPIVAGISRFRDREPLLQRDQLDESDPRKWRKKDVDPWQLTFFLGFADTAEADAGQFVFATTSDGGKEALGDLWTAYIEHNDGRESVESPVAQLDTRNYTNSFDKKIYVPVFTVVGWLPPPTGFRTLSPPADSVPQIPRHHGQALIDGTTGDDPMDDDIPF